MLFRSEVVNVAARLEQNAGTGEILIGPDTLAALAGMAIVVEVGSLALKGKTDRVQAHRLLGIREDAPELSFDVPFVGRTEQLAALDAARGLVTVYGEAGIGKTRLIREWLATRRPDGLVGSGRCHPYRDEASLMPLAVALREVVRGPSTLPAGLLTDGTPGQSQAACCAAIAATLAELAPVTLVLDDLHWADRMLLDVIERVVAALDGADVLVIGAARPDLLPRPLWSARSGAVTMPPLSIPESERLAAELVEVAAHGAVAEAVVRRAEGNPLYLEQLLSMVNEGADPDQLPAIVTSVLAARIDALEAGERAVLDAAAVVGRQFCVTEIDLLVGTAEPLGKLAARRLIEPDGSHGYRFHSGLVRDVTYQGISKQQRSDWHEKLAAPSEGAASAHHFEQSYQYRAELGLHDAHTETLRGRAAQSLAEAGRFALARADLSWSEDLYRRALRHSETGDAWWPSIGQGLGETLFAKGESDEGRTLLNGVLAAHDEVAVAHARLQLAALDLASDQAPVAEIARAALPLFRAASDDLGLARANARLAQEQQLLGRHGEAENRLGEALRQALAADAEPELAMVLGAMGVSLWLGPTPAADAVRRCRALLAEHGTGRQVVLVTLGCPLAVLLGLQGHGNSARRVLAEITPLARDLGYAEAMVFLPLFEAAVASLAGRLDDAERLLRVALAHSRDVGNVGLDGSVARELARVLLARGADPGTVLGELDAAELPPAEAADELGVRALLRSVRGESSAAFGLAEQAVDMAERTDSPVTRAAAQLDLAEVSLAAGRFEPALNAAGVAERLFRAKGHRVGVRRATRLAARVPGGTR